MNLLIILLHILYGSTARCHTGELTTIYEDHSYLYNPSETDAICTFYDEQGVAITQVTLYPDGSYFETVYLLPYGESFPDSVTTYGNIGSLYDNYPQPY